MKYILTVIALMVASTAWAEDNLNNKVMKQCLQMTGDSFETYNFTKASACYDQWKTGELKKEYAELRDFLKHNPRYRYPGQSNNKCWGKPRVQPFESSGIEFDGKGGYRAWVNYKDTIPAGCYETAPWDNRDAKN